MKEHTHRDAAFTHPQQLQVLGLLSFHGCKIRPHLGFGHLSSTSPRTEDHPLPTNTRIQSYNINFFDVVEGVGVWVPSHVLLQVLAPPLLSSLM